MIELLSPVGDFECLKAAVQNGADAIYMGANLFSARAFATNFDDAELEKAINYAKLRGVKTHLTLNTLIKNDEFEEAFNLAKKAYELGIDAITVQDLGLATKLIKEFPDLDIHASTQMTTTNLSGIKELEKLGFKRAVLSREVSLPEIENISLTTIINSFKQMFVELIGVFSINNIKSPMFWLGLFVLANIFLHVSISKADLKNAAIGIIFFIILIPLFSILFSFTGIAPADFALWCFKVNFVFLFMLIFGLFIDILILLFSMLAFKIKKIYYKKVKKLIIK